MCGLHNDLWPNLMLLALKQVVWVKNAVGVIGGFLHGEARVSAGHLGAGQHGHDTVMLGSRLCHSIAKWEGPQVSAGIFFPV